MAYLRHRDRHVGKSVYEDAVRVLDAWNWTSDWPVPLLEGEVVVFIDYFPETTDPDDETTISVKLERNVLAIDMGEPGEPFEWELGGLMAQEYQFLWAFNAASDSIAQALFQDLADRYWGNTDSPFISLYDYTQNPKVEVVRMEVEEFRFRRSDEETGPGIHLWIAQLVIRDFFVQERVPIPEYVTVDGERLLDEDGNPIYF